MLRTIRLSAAIVCFTLITLLFLDFTGTLHTWFGWLAKIQFLPALLALNIGVVLFLIVLTFLFGRIYLQSPNQKIPDRKTKCVIKTHINIKQNVIFGAKLKPV